MYQAQSTRDATGERILAAATRCIRRWGIRHVSMGDVAREAGVSRMSVYRHFTDRDALVLAVLERLDEQTLRTAAPLVRRRRTLAAQIAEAAVFIRTHRNDEHAALNLAGRPGESELATLRLAHGSLDRWIAFWVPFIEAARERGEVRDDLDIREAGEWIMRVLVSLMTVPSATVDLDDGPAVRRFVSDHIVRGFQ